MALMSSHGQEISGGRPAQALGISSGKRFALGLRQRELTQALVGVLDEPLSQRGAGDGCILVAAHVQGCGLLAGYAE